MPLLPADFTHARVCKPFCEKSLTLPKPLEYAHLVLSDNMEQYVQGTPEHWLMD